MQLVLNYAFVRFDSKRMVQLIGSHTWQYNKGDHDSYHASVVIKILLIVSEASQRAVEYCLWKNIINRMSFTSSIVTRVSV
jgi:hypothetical protein